MKQAIKWLVKIVVGSWRMLADYRPIFNYNRDKFGLRFALRYLWLKFFLRGERNGFGLLDPFAYLFPDKFPEPYMYEGEFTTKCNLACAVCERTYWKTGKNWDMPFDDSSAPIDFLRLMSKMPKMLYFNPTGIGEFFLNPHWNEMLEYWRKNDIYVNIVDNFAHTSDEQIRALVDYGVQRVFISIDGMEGIYENMRPGAKWEKTIANIRKLQEYRKEKQSPIPEICYKYIISDLTSPQMADFVEFVGTQLKTVPASGDDNMVEFLGLMPFEGQKYGYENIPSCDWFDRIVCRGKKLGVKVLYAHHTNHIRDMRSCVVWQEPFIIEGRYVLPCCALLVRNDRDRIRSLAFGDLAKDDFRTIWESERYKKFRKQFKDTKAPIDPICSGCRVFDTSCREKERGIA